MRLTRAQENDCVSWLQRNEKTFYAFGRTHKDVRDYWANQLGVDLNISLAQMRRVSLYARSSGRIRWWHGGRKMPLPTAGQHGDRPMELLFRLNELAGAGVFNPRVESPFFVARYLCDGGFPSSPDDVKQAIACMNRKGPARREDQGSSTRTAVAL